MHEIKFARFKEGCFGANGPLILQMSSTSASSSTASSSTSAPFNTKQIEQILTENDGFLNAIQEFQSMGKISEVIE